MYLENVDIEDNCSNEHISNISNNNSSFILSGEGDQNEDFILQELRLWAVKHNVSQSSLTDLLHILAQYHPSLPMDSRTLLATPTSTPNISKLDTGDYYYFGLKYIF